MATTETTTETAAVEKIKRGPRIKDNTIIHMGKDAEGKAYGPDYNPKRQGSKAAARWPGYAEGKTVGEAKAAGLTAGDITYDRDHGFITLEAVAEPVATPVAQAA